MEKTRALRYCAFFLLLVFAEFPSTNALSDDDYYEAFIIPHTHDDVGWLLTVDEYFIRQVQYILDSCIQQLQDNPERKFTYVEVAYFERWWHRISPQKRQAVIDLVKAGQLEFNLGGITMNDEATTSYIEEINQMTEGSLFTQKNLGATAQSAWHIDPFGHSAVTASLWAQIGFNGFVLNRIPQWLKDKKKQNKELEFIWQPSKSLGNQIWIHVLDEWYSSTGAIGFNRNDGFGGIYVQDDPNLFDVNVKQIADDFVAMVKSKATMFRHKKLLLPYGDDFAHREAYNSFVNMDKLLKYVNANFDTYGVKARYAFLSEYVQAVNALNITWPVFQGDFFPYNDDDHSYWSGYYTSRPHLKQFVRSSDATLFGLESLYVLARSTVPSFNRSEAFDDIQVLREATSLATHHDAVSGTEKQHVAEDYAKRIQIGLDTAQPLIGQISDLLTANKHSELQSTLTLKVYNPLAWTRHEFASILISSSSAVVTNATGFQVPSQVVPVPSYSKEYSQDNSYKLYFLVKLAPLAIETYTVVLQNEHRPTFKPFELNRNGADQSISNEFLTVTVSSATGRLSSITDKTNGNTIEISQNYLQYRPSSSQSGAPSGAYIFRPDTNSAFSIGDCQQGGSKQNLQLYFPVPFDQTPFFLITPSSGDFDDIFLTTTSTVSSNKAFISVLRVNSDQSWGQNLNADYLAWQPSDLPAGCQIGSAAVGSSSNPFKSISVTFPQAFQTAPVVFVVARTNGGTLSFAVTTFGVSSSSFSVNVLRADTSAGWSQDLVIDWIAVEPASDFEDSFIAGSSKLTSSSRQAMATITHNPITSDPIVLTSVRLGSPSKQVFLSTVRAKSPGDFRANVYCVSDSSWGQSVYVDYIILPRQPIIDPVVDDSEIQTTIMTGTFVSEIRQVFKTGYAQTFRLFAGTSDPFIGQQVQITHDIGPLDLGRELVTQFSTNLQNKLTIYSDDNGLEMQERVFNSTRPELVAGNYYPMVNRAYMRDLAKGVQVTLLSDSTHGVAGLSEGQIEVMLHRRCLSDDNRGVGEVLNETDTINPSLWLVFSDIPSSAQFLRRLSLQQQFPPIISVSQSNQNYGFHPVTNELPFNVHLLSFRDVDAGSNQTILRLQHIFEIDEDPVYSKPATVDLASFFAAPYKIKNVVEMNLTANKKKSEMKELVWQTTEKRNLPVHQHQEVKGTVVTLSAMQIRTFLIDFEV